MYLCNKKNMNNNKVKCNHRWIMYSAYKECSICQERIWNPAFYNVDGVISDEDVDFLEVFQQDEEEHKHVLQRNGKAYQP